WFRDLKAGRSVATNGPLLRVFVNGKPPGAEFPYRKGMRAKIAIEVDAQGPLQTVEIVFNGQVSRAFPRAENGSFKTSVELAIGAPGWLAVRCFEPPGETIRYTHSSPFYFPAGAELPVKRSEALKWADYIRRLASSVAPAAYPSRQDYDRTQATFLEAGNIYQNLAQRGE